MSSLTALPAALTAALATALVSGCSIDEAPAGRMTEQTYERLAAIAPDIDVDDVVNNGGTHDTQLTQAYVAEGGAPPHVGQDCYYATTHPSARKYSGTAQFCFDAAGQFLSASRSTPFPSSASG
jgi:hypothetical protein